MNSNFQLTAVGSSGQPRHPRVLSARLDRVNTGPYFRRLRTDAVLRVYRCNIPDPQSWSQVGVISDQATAGGRLFHRERAEQALMHDRDSVTIIIHIECAVASALRSVGCSSLSRPGQAMIHRLRDPSALHQGGRQHATSILRNVYAGACVGLGLP